MIRFLATLLILGSADVDHSTARDLQAALPPISVTADGKNIQSSYCGLYCLAVAAQLGGATVDPDELFRSRYLNGKYGSCIADLTQAASLLKVRLEVFQNLTFRDLACRKEPVICLIFFNLNR